MRALLTAAVASVLLVGTTSSSASLLPFPIGQRPAVGATAPAPSPAPAPLLRVSGNAILDPAGNPVVLRGLNRSSTERPPATRHAVTDTEIGWLTNDNAGSWHATAIRVLMDAAQWTGECPRLASSSDTYRAAIDAEVDSITRRGATALLDLHMSTAGCRSAAQHAMPDAPVAQDFWWSVATRYANNPRVAFELYNEPHYVDSTTWLRGTAKTTMQDCDPKWGPAQLAACRASAPPYRAVGMQELYDIVTRAAPGHLVVVDGIDYATAPPTVRLNDSAGQLVYGMHAYECPAVACATAANDHANDALLQQWVEVGRTVPVLATELGWPEHTPNGEVTGVGYYQETLDFLAAHSWGWLAFAMDGTSDGVFRLTDGSAGYGPTPTGKVVYDALRAG